MEVFSETTRKKFVLLHDCLIILFLYIPINFRYEFHHAVWHWGENSLQGSEHHLDGVQQPMEVQLFHWNTKYSDYNTAAQETDGLAAVSFFYEVSSADNPEISGQISVLEQLIEVSEQKFGNLAQRHFAEWLNLEKPFPTSSLSQLLPSGSLDVSDNYFYYSGSLTLPNTTTTTTITTTTTLTASRAKQTNAHVEVEDCSESVLWIVYQKKIAISEAQLSVYRNFLSIIQLCSHNFRPLHPLNPSVLTSGVSQPATGRKSNY